MNTKPRAALLSSRLDWIALQILILFVVTVIYTVVIWRVEAPNAQTTLDTFRVVVKEVVPLSQYTIICILGLFELGGAIMLFYFHKVEQAIKQGRAEVYREWREDWERRRQEAMHKGLPFDEPPPPNSENGTVRSDRDSFQRILY